MPLAPQAVTERTAPLVFIHAAPRTSSTWFWSKFREHPAALCFFEPFGEAHGWIKRDLVSTWNRSSWQSRHPPTEPYFEEYLPLLRETGGVQLFDPSMPLKWFIPLGGLRGQLRPSEKDYLSLFIRHAHEDGRTPVFKCLATLGRCWAIREEIGGLNIFQYRNLWQTWRSYLSYIRQGNLGFYLMVVDRICQDGDAYFQYLVERGLDYSAQALTDRTRALERDRGHLGTLIDEADVQRLESLAEHHAFALFMGLHIYLYLHAQLSTDLAADTTRMARDNVYRADIERAIERHTGLPISFSDVSDVDPANGIKVDVAAIDWDEIRAHARVAVGILSAFDDPTRLTKNANGFIDDAIEEMGRSRAELSATGVTNRIRSVEVRPPEPENPRSWYDLAQTEFNAGRFVEAAQAYGKRAGMAGSEEEVWYSRLQEARCLRDLGDEASFIRQALEVYNQRPNRAEPLCDLARFYCGRGMHETSMFFAEAGLALARPEGDPQFIEDIVYEWRLRQEVSIAGFYCRDPARKDCGSAACNWLALNRNIPGATRDMARRNLRFYAEPAAKLMPSFAARPVGLMPPEGWHATNPSVARRGDEIVMVQRAVNYRLEGGNYRTPNGAPIATRNFLLRLNAALDIASSLEILPPADLPAPVYGLALGFEDMRLFAWRGALWCIATLRELTPEGWCQQVLARIDESDDGQCRLADWRVLAPEGPPRHEKNWMPLLEADLAGTGGGTLRFIYLCDPTRLVDDDAQVLAETTPAIAAEQFRGGSQAVEFDGGWLALVHEEVAGATFAERAYHHRFVWLDNACALRGVSRPFFLQKPGVEFAAGLAWHSDGRRLIVSYGVGDREAWIATVYAVDVRGLLMDVTQSPSGAPPLAGVEEKNAPIGMALRAADTFDRSRGRSRTSGTWSGRNAWHKQSQLIVGFYGDGEEVLGPVLDDFFNSVLITGPRTELCDIMTARRSDKSNWHNYTLLYHFLFRHRRSEIRNVFELGIGTNFADVPSSMGRGGTPGASLRGWRDYFPFAKIIGADVDKRILFTEDRISTLYVDQTNKADIITLWKNIESTSFDIMIDDGLHTFEANTIFMENSIHKLKHNGFYIIEDIWTTENNLKNFHGFFQALSGVVSGALIKLPSLVNHIDNCVAIFRPNKFASERGA